METHTLTTEQVQKFVGAIGGGGQLTTQQLKTLAKSVNGLNDFPQYTDDPRVNYAIDCILMDDGDVPPYDERMYVAEAEAFKAVAKSA